MIRELTCRVQDATGTVVNRVITGTIHRVPVAGAQRGSPQRRLTADFADELRSQTLFSLSQTPAVPTVAPRSCRGNEAGESESPCVPPPHVVGYVRMKKPAEAASAPVLICAFCIIGG
jgi:hypothetical protein